MSKYTGNLDDIIVSHNLNNELIRKKVKYHKERKSDNDTLLSLWDEEFFDLPSSPSSGLLLLWVLQPDYIPVAPLQIHR